MPDTEKPTVVGERFLRIRATLLLIFLGYVFSSAARSLIFAFLSFATPLLFLVLVFVANRAHWLAALPIYFLLAWLLLGMILFVGSKKRLDKAYGRVLRGTWIYRHLVVFAFLANTLVLAVSLFGAATFTAHKFAFIEYSGTGAIGASGVMSFFAWQLADMVPVLDLTNTLNWSMPLRYEGSAVGSVVVAFKLLVILPILGAFKVAFGIWAEHEDQVQGQPSRMANALPHAEAKSLRKETANSKRRSNP